MDMAACPRWFWPSVLDSRRRNVQRTQSQLRVELSLVAGPQLAFPWLCCNQGKEPKWSLSPDEALKNFLLLLSIVLVLHE